MSARTSDLLNGLAPSATLAVDAKAKALKAAGEPVIGYGVGEPDFPTPVHIVEAAVKACYDPVNYKYTPTAGIPELREAIAAKSMRDSGLDVKASQVLVTNGGKHSIATAFITLLNPGDEVLDPRALLDDLPRSGVPDRRDARAGDDERGEWLSHHCRGARALSHEEDEDVGLQLALQPLGCGPSPR